MHAPRSVRPRSKPMAGLLPSGTGALSLGILATLSLLAPKSWGSSPSLIENYKAPSVCPSQTDLEQAIRARLAGSSHDHLNRERTLSIVIESRNSEYFAELSISGSNHAVAHRQLHSGDCAELGQALALVGAVLLEAPNPWGQDNDEERGDRGTTPAPIPRHAGKAAAQGETDRDKSSRLTLGVGGEMRTDVAPSAAFGPRVSLELGRSLSHNGHGLAVRLSGGRTASEESPIPASQTQATAHFIWTTGRLDGCALLRISSAVAITPCLAMELGALTGQQHSAAGATSRGALWVATGTTLREALRLWGPLGLYLEESLSVPLVFPRFYFDAQGADSPVSVTVHRVPGLGFGLGLGLSFQFPRT